MTGSDIGFEADPRGRPEEGRRPEAGQRGAALDPPGGDSPPSRAMLLAQASRTFVEAVPDYGALLDTVARQVAKATGDGCTVRLLTADGQRLEPMAGYHQDPALQAAIHAVMRETVQRDDSGVWQSVLEHRQTIRLDVSPQQIPDAASAPQAAFMRRYALRALMCAPLVARGRVIGGLSLARYGSGPPYTAEDELLLRDLADRAALALDTARLYEAERVARAEAEGSARRFRDLVQNLDAIVWEADLTPFRVTFMSQRTEAILGYPVERWLTEPDWWLSHLHADDREAAGQLRQAALAAGRDYTVDYRFLAADGRTVWLRDQVRLVREDDSVIRVHGVTVDLTERKRADEEREGLETQLRQAQKLEAIGRLAGGIAHDFNNLLTVMRGRTELLGLELPPNDPRGRHLVLIQQTAERAATLTRQLLAFSRKQVLQPRVLDLNALITGLEVMLRPLIGEDIALVTVPAPDLGRIRTDPGQLEQVIMNLVVNARDAMPRGGRLSLETANVELDENYARQHVGVKPGRYVLLAVSDTGIGMDAAIQARIFEPFFTTKAPGQGTGLGLATAYGIIKQSGGNIWVYSEPGHGTTFKIYLPRVEAASEGLAPSGAGAAAPRGSDTILLVEDDEGLRELALEMLQNQGYVVLAASNPVEALQLTATYAGPIHLAVTDVIMPHMSGREFATQLATRRPETKVLYMSGYTDDAIAHHGVLEPGTALLEKPFTRDAFLRKIRERLGAGA